MAKSLRSKWKRKMRAAKRVRYGKKEHDKLKNMLETHLLEVSKNGVDVKNAEVIDKTVELEEETILENNENVKEEIMEVDKHIFNSKTMRDQYGNYPAWLNIRKIRKLSRKSKNIKHMKRQRNKKPRKVVK